MKNFCRWCVSVVMWLGIVVAFGLVILITFWLIYPYKILTFTEGNGTFIETTIKRGEFLQMRQHSCKTMDITSTINRQFVDGIIYQVPTINANRPIGCTQNIEYIFVSEALPYGEYYINTVITFHPNPLRTVSYTVKTEKFTIVK